MSLVGFMYGLKPVPFKIKPMRFKWTGYRAAAKATGGRG